MPEVSQIIIELNELFEKLAAQEWPPNFEETFVEEVVQAIKVILVKYVTVLESGEGRALFQRYLNQCLNQTCWKMRAYPFLVYYLFLHLSQEDPQELQLAKWLACNTIPWDYNVFNSVAIGPEFWLMELFVRTLFVDAVKSKKGLDLWNKVVMDKRNLSIQFDLTSFLTKPPEYPEIIHFNSFLLVLYLIARGIKRGVGNQQRDILYMVIKHLLSPRYQSAGGDDYIDWDTYRNLLDGLLYLWLQIPPKDLKRWVGVAIRLLQNDLSLSWLILDGPYSPYSESAALINKIGPYIAQLQDLEVLERFNYICTDIVTRHLKWTARETELGPTRALFQEILAAEWIEGARFLLEYAFDQIHYSGVYHDETWDGNTDALYDMTAAYCEKTSDSSVIRFLLPDIQDFHVIRWYKEVFSYLIEMVREKIPEVIGSLLMFLLDTDAEVRRGSAWMLGELKEKRALNHLLEMLQDPNKEVRKTVVEALGIIGDVKTIELLTHTLDDPDGDVRKAANRALTQIQRKQH